MSIPEDDKRALTGDEVAREVPGDWRQLRGAIHARFATGDFLTGLRFVTRVAAVAEEANHHPDVDLRYPHVDVALASHDVGALTARDVRLSRVISEIATEEGVSSVPAALQEVELALDTADAAGVRPFWAAVLGLDPGKGTPDEVVDPSGRLPTLWFQSAGDRPPGEAPPQRFHYDVHVPHDEAEARVAAAIDAGGELVSDAEAPSFWVLADPEGNKACVCTWQARG